MRTRFIRRVRARAAARRLGRLLALAALAAALGGCVNPFSPRVSTARVVSQPAPRPTTPLQLVALFEWCWENRDIREYETLFTEDFRFVFSDVEAAEDPPILRDEEIAIARRIFVDGTADQPRANRIALEFIPPLVVYPDTRPGKTDPWHKRIPARIDLEVDLESQRVKITGSVNFYVVRGDSALLPQDLKDRGFTPDPSRWYIELWEDRTDEGSSALLAAALDAALRAPRQDPAPAESPAVAAPSTAGLPARPVSGGAASGEPRSVSLSWTLFKRLFR